MKKLFLFLMFCVLGAFAAEQNAFTLEANKKVIQPGDAIELKVALAPLEGYQARAWNVVFFESDVPQGAAEALGKAFSKAARPEWRYAKVFEAWFAKNTLEQKERTLLLKTSPKWVKGDYKVKIQIIFRQNPPNVKTDKYVSRELMFTIE